MLRLKNFLHGRILPGHEPDPRYIRALNYARYFKAAGWDSHQVDRERAWLIDLLIPISNLIQEVADERR